MKQTFPVIKEKDWSLNMEGPEYEADVDMIFADSIDAIEKTKPGCYVNLVTPGVHDDPRVWFIDELSNRLAVKHIPVREIRYIDECGCGGFVTRAYR